MPCTVGRFLCLHHRSGPGINAFLRLPLCRQGHAHWVNTLALSTEAVLRTGAYDHRGNAPKDPKEAKEVAVARWVQGGTPQRYKDKFTPTAIQVEREM